MTEIGFTNESTGALSYFWEFGDGNTSTEENPTHVYEEPGIYTPTLTAYSENGKKESVASHDITIEAPTIDVNFRGQNYNIEHGCYYYEPDVPGISISTKEDIFPRVLFYIRNFSGTGSYDLTDSGETFYLGFMAFLENSQTDYIYLNHYYNNNQSEQIFNGTINITYDSGDRIKGTANANMYGRAGSGPYQFSVTFDVPLLSEKPDWHSGKNIIF
jgi:PKD repeat protein